MKKLALSFLTLTIITGASAQVPQALNYQAVARNSLGQIVPSQNIGVRFTITDATGNITHYQETHTTTTNNFGLFTLAIGKGTAVSGTIPSIDWSTGGDKYLKVEIAPQGGTTYTIQGTTQLLSVPYSLYSEKTRLIGGNAITITNGNTISANYQAGPGISITGSVISSTATLNSWLLAGNAGTTAANFLGTTDNQRIYFRTNNITRMYLDQSIPAFGVDLGHLSLSSEADVAIRPSQLSIFGRDIAGASMPALFVSYVGGATWGIAGGNTSGRFFRLSQMSTTFVQSHFYDVGMSQDSSFYIGNHGFQNVGGVLAKKMFTISPQDMVGINLDMSEKPTAVFHTKGSLRFQNINTNNTYSRILAMDANGNVASRDASTFGGSGSNAWSLTGNAGTTAANFLGTTDNLPVNFRTNNIHRLSISESSIIGTNNASYIIAGQQSNFNTNPVSLAVYGKDIGGSLLPFGVATNIAGMNFDPAGGSNNTLGRQVRWSQWPNNSSFVFYDQGIDQEGDYFITEQGLSGTGGSFPKKMLQISATDNVGINMAWAENPTANFHTKGTLRFEGVNTNNTFARILAMDANGNVASRDASTFGGSGSNAWSLTGNAGTTAANFLGTTDDQRINFRTNNITRMYLDPSIPAFGVDLGHLSLSSETDVAIRPAQITVFGRDIAGASLNGLFVSYVGGSTWGVAGGNTLGRFFRLSQMATTFVQSHFYDIGMSQDSSFYITNHGFQNIGGVMPKKMITISPQDMMGINLDMSEKPKARLHVKNGDVYLDQVGSGVIMKSPNGQCWRMTVSNAGAPVFTAIPCP